MKKIFFILLMALLNCAAVCSALEVRLEPVRRNITSGNFIQLQLSSDREITRIELPEVRGAQWENSYSSSGMQSINGKVTFTRTLMLTPSVEGLITIPPVKVTAGSESVMTKEVQVRVLPRGKSDSREVKIQDVVKGKITFAEKKKSFYAGEEITLYCDLLVASAFLAQIRPDYFPVLLNTGDAVFSTFPYRNRQIRFQASSPEEILIDDRPFFRYRFTARCRVMIPGTFAPGASLKVNVIQQNRYMADDFFDAFASSRTIPYTVRFTPAPAVEIKALPPLPAGSVSTGLIGQWQISGKISSASLRQGEVAELVLNFKGSGSTENFRLAPLTLPGFRLYPPEVTVKGSEITAKCAIVPLESGEKTLKLNLAFFDPAAGKWESVPFEFKAAVARNTEAATPAVRKNFTPPPVKENRETQNENRSSEEQYLLYQKSIPGKWIELPLLRNNIFWLIFFLAGMPLAAILMELRFRRRAREESSPGLREQKQHQKALKELAGELKRKGDTPEFREKLIPLLGESLGLSAGASAGDIARNVTDPELCRYFAGIESESFMPGGSSQTLLNDKGKKALLAILKKYSVLLLCCLSFCSLQGNELNQEFNRGEFAKAAVRYLKLSTNGNAYRPAMLYNYGNSQYHLNNLPEARWALNLARLLDPSDREIRTNLELVNARFFTAEEKNGSFSSALAEMRDHIRCDHYLLFAAFCWGMLWILWSFRRKMASSLCYGCSGILLCVCLLCLFSAATQLQGIYSDRRIIITAPQAELRSLPGKNSGVTESTIPGGSEGELMEQASSGFCRVRINGREGWISETSFKHAFPGKIW